MPHPLKVFLVSFIAGTATFLSWGYKDTILKVVQPQQQQQQEQLNAPGMPTITTSPSSINMAGSGYSATTFAP